MFFSRAAQQRILDITNSMGMSAALGLMDSAIAMTGKGLLAKALSWVSRAGSFVMDIGDAIIGLGWRVTVYGFATWASVGLFRNLGRLIKRISGGVLRTLPETLEVAA